MRIDTQLVPSAPNPNVFFDRVVVIIDVLRATSVILHAMSEGASEVLPLASVEEALQMAKAFPRGSVLLGGERESGNIPGFDLGNSPRDYVAEKVREEEIDPDDNQWNKGVSFGFFRERNFSGKFF